MQLLDNLLLVCGFLFLVVMAFRMFIRRPREATQLDPPGIRSIAMFSGDDPSFFADDQPEDLLVGCRLFDDLCERLAGDRATDITFGPRSRMMNALTAVCRIEGRMYALVLEWMDPRWAISVEWAPKNGAERRHQRWVSAVYAPEDGQPLVDLLETVDRVLREHPRLSEVAWYRRERWANEDWDDPTDSPCG